MAEMFSWLLSMHPILTILIVSLFVSVISVVIYKFATNQTKLKSIQDEQKKLREELKKHQKNPEKAMKLQKRAMELSMEIMPESMKSMLFTFIPVIIVFGWLSANMSYMPLNAGDSFSAMIEFEKIVPGQTATVIAPPGIGVVDTPTQDVIGDKVSWQLKAQAVGNYNLTFEYGTGETFTMPLIVAEEGSRQYINPVLTRQSRILFIGPAVGPGISDKSNVKSIKIDMKPIRPFGESFNLFGWHPGWLSVYIVSSLVFTSLLRKYLKVY